MIIFIFFIFCLIRDLIIRAILSFRGFIFFISYYEILLALIGLTFIRDLIFKKFCYYGDIGLTVALVLKCFGSWKFYCLLGRVLRAGLGCLGFQLLRFHCLKGSTILDDEAHLNLIFSGVYCLTYQVLLN